MLDLAPVTDRCHRIDRALPRIDRIWIRLRRLPPREQTLLAQRRLQFLGKTLRADRAKRKRSIGPARRTRIGQFQLVAGWHGGSLGCVGLVSGLQACAP